MTKSNHSQGSILREKGGELKWWSVPEYTADLSAIYDYFWNRGLMLKMTMSTPYMVIRMKEKNKDPSLTRRWSMSAWEPRWMEQRGWASHDASAAICACLLAVEIIIAPKNRHYCAQCAEPFIPSSSTLKQLQEVKDQTPPGRLIPTCMVCPPCSDAIILDMMKGEGNA